MAEATDNLEEVAVNEEEASQENTKQEPEASEYVEVNEDMDQKKDSEVNEYKDRLQRIMAEFDNFRKRTIKEKSNMYENGVKETIEKLLPVIDNFERAMCSCSDEDKGSPFAQGVEMILKQLKGVMTELGVVEIDALNKEFDPNYHNAVTHAEDEDLGENMVAEVFQKGYMYKESVLRHSMVKVVN